jgi:S1-C subfamily serine protease
VAAFSRYRDMFSATDPTAEQYSHTAQQFTTRMEALGVKGGVYIFKLIDGGAASKAGLAIGDIVINYNGQTLEQMNDLVSVRKNAPENIPLKITYLRMDKEGRFTSRTATVKNPMGAGFKPV